MYAQARILERNMYYSSHYAVLQLVLCAAIYYCSYAQSGEFQDNFTTYNTQTWEFANDELFTGLGCMVYYEKNHSQVNHSLSKDEGHGLVIVMEACQKVEDECKGSKMASGHLQTADDHLYGDYELRMRAPYTVSGDGKTCSGVIFFCMLIKLNSKFWRFNAQRVRMFSSKTSGLCLIVEQGTCKEHLLLKIFSNLWPWFECKFSFPVSTSARRCIFVKMHVCMIMEVWHPASGMHLFVHMQIQWLLSWNYYMGGGLC